MLQMFLRLTSLGVCLVMFLNNVRDVSKSMDPIDCYDVMSSLHDEGVYSIQPRDDGPPINVYCLKYSGWLTIQRRKLGNVDFYKTWNEYRDGFGNLSTDFWLGNYNIHRITQQTRCQLKVVMYDFGDWFNHACYNDFSVASEEDYFRLKIGKYAGNAGDGLTEMHANMSFSTHDQDHDTSSSNCGEVHHGGWWYGNCATVNLNGKYVSVKSDVFPEGIIWFPWRNNTALKVIEMLVRPISELNDECG